MLFAVLLAGCGGSSVSTNPYRGSYTGVEWGADQNVTSNISVTVDGSGGLCGSLTGSIDPSGYLKSNEGNGRLYGASGGFVVILVDGSGVTTTVKLVKS